MEKIIFEDLPSTKTPLNAENLNQLQTNVENAIKEVDNRTIYSTTEQVVGTWINGKPIYRKTLSVTGGLSFNSHKFAFNHNIGNFGMPISVTGVLYDTLNKNYFCLPYITTSEANIMLYCSPTQITVEQNPYENNRLKDLYVILEYTKTTDTAL